MALIEILTQYWPKIIDGAGITLLLTGMGAVLAAIFAPLLALIRAQGSALAQVPVRLYISFIRGTAHSGAAVPCLLWLGAVPARVAVDRPVAFLP